MPISVASSHTQDDFSAPLVDVCNRNPGCNRGLSLSSLRKAAPCGSSPQPFLSLPLSSSYSGGSVTNCTWPLNPTHTLKETLGSINTGDDNCVVKTVFFCTAELKEQNGGWRWIHRRDRSYDFFLMWHISAFSSLSWELNTNRAGHLMKELPRPPLFDTDCFQTTSCVH